MYLHMYTHINMSIYVYDARTDDDSEICSYVSMHVIIYVYACTQEDILEEEGKEEVRVMFISSIIVMFIFLFKSFRLIYLIRVENYFL
jgi:hypothetical protein